MQNTLISSNPDRPLSQQDLRQQLVDSAHRIADWCQSFDGRFHPFEKQLRKLIGSFASLCIALFLHARHERLKDQNLKHPGYRRFHKPIERDLATSFGTVRYLRDYWIPTKGGSGFHPLDVELGLTRDGFSPWVISIAVRLCTYLSYAKTELIMKAFCGWSPSTETIEQWVLGVGRQAASYMALPPTLPEAEGEVLVIEVDGKAVPMATYGELKKRRGPRKCRAKGLCNCQRHRSQDQRRDPNKAPEKRRKKGDKSKNGKSATLVAMYTLRVGPDGKLHGPINKQVWGSFAQRKNMLAWARAQATRRGFGPDTDRTIQIVVDGEVCLARRLKKLFPKAILTLDVRHVEERLWKAGGAFHAEGSPELKAWVEKLRSILYGQGGKQLIAKLRRIERALGDEEEKSGRKRKALASLLKYLKPRKKMMCYADWMKRDLVIASGVIEGAVRYVIGERLDCSGMRWVKGRAEAVLQLRCIEVNGMWDHFFTWCQDQWQKKLDAKEAVQIRTDQPLELTNAA